MPARLRQPPVIASRKAWATRSGTLVEDGDPEAAYLFARKGQRMSASNVAQFENASDFFSGLGNAGELTQAAPAAKSRATPRPAVPKASKDPSRRRAGLF